MSNSHGPLVVAYLYNTNGMAAWCLEAAQALAEVGEEVVLVHLPEITPPTMPNLRSVPWSYRASSLTQRIAQRLEVIAGHIILPRTNRLLQIHKHLTALDIHPRAYLLNQTDLSHPGVPVPQYVTGWAYPTHFRGYFDKTPSYVGSGYWSKEGMEATNSSIGWWRRDWASYRSTAGVLAVSHRIQQELSAAGVNVHVVHPGTKVYASETSGSGTTQKDGNTPLRLVSSCLVLSDYRKRIKWLIDALNQIETPNFTLTLIGEATPEFRASIAGSKFPIEITGKLTRDASQAVMESHDVFLFGSRMDDWGYVLIEAMGRGLCVVAPRLSPFDEIVGDGDDSAGELFAPYDPADVARTISQLTHDKVIQYRQQSRQRAQTLFSRPAFARAILAAIS